MIEWFVGYACHCLMQSVIIFRERERERGRVARNGHTFHIISFENGRIQKENSKMCGKETFENLTRKVAERWLVLKVPYRKFISIFIKNS